MALAGTFQCSQNPLVWNTRSMELTFSVTVSGSHSSPWILLTWINWVFSFVYIQIYIYFVLQFGNFMGNLSPSFGRKVPSLYEGCSCCSCINISLTLLPILNADSYVGGNKDDKVKAIFLLRCITRGVQQSKHEMDWLWASVHTLLGSLCAVTHNTCFAWCVIECHHP